VLWRHTWCPAAAAAAAAAAAPQAEVQGKNQDGGIQLHTRSIKFGKVRTACGLLLLFSDLNSLPVSHLYCHSACCPSTASTLHIETQHAA
jgi:hypothetical protein